MGRQTRKRTHLLIRIIRCVAVAGRHEQALPQPVRAVVRQEQEERPGAVLLDEPDGVLGPEVGGVPRLGDRLALVNDRDVVERRGVPVRLGDPVPERLLRMEVAAQVPLAHQAAGVPGVGQDLGQRAELADGAVRVGPRLGAAGPQVTVDAVLRRDEARQQGGPGGRADGVAGERPREADALGRQAVDVRRADIRVAVAAERPGALVVGQDEEEVRAARRAGGGGVLGATRGRTGFLRARTCLAACRRKPCRRSQKPAPRKGHDAPPVSHRRLEQPARPVRAAREGRALG